MDRTRLRGESQIMAERGGTHERLTGFEELRTSSNRGFGLVIATALVVIALLPMIRGEGVQVWSLGVSIAVLLVALFAPDRLAPFNRTWTRFGLLLHRLIGPLVLGLLFFLVFTPMALVLRALGKDPLRLRFDPGAKSYWIARAPAGPPPQSMRDQF